ncbi:MAG: cardiolipin synthase [Syntrophobacteraceae bacterium]
MFLDFWDVLRLVIPLAMLPVVAARSQPAAAIAWMLLFVFLPWIGLVLYALFGGNWVLRRLTKSYCQRIKEIRSFHDSTVCKPHLLYSPHSNGLSLATISERLVCLPAVAGNRVELLENGNIIIDRLIADIEAAANHVHLLFYIFRDDPTGRRVAEAMAGAARRGVRTRLVVDAFGSRSIASELGPWLEANGVELKYLMPVNPFRRHHTRLDLRNHRKLAVIDGNIAYTGSQNIEAKDYGEGRPEAWHDLMARITGPAVLQLQMVFIEDWYLAANEILDSPELFPVTQLEGDIPVQTIPTGPTEPNTALRDILISAIGAAHESIIITSPYFIPDEPLRVALYLASLKGVKIDLLIPGHTDHVIVGAVARAYISTLIDSGINIYFHRGLLHSKTMSVDRLVSVIGTANFDRRSLFLHSELSLLLYGQEITQRLRAVQAKYIAQSVPLVPLRWKRRSAVKRMRDNILKILSPIL